MRRQNDARECLRKRLLEPGHTPATPRNQPHIARGSAAAGRCLREREGRFASFLTPAPSGTDLPPLATQHAGKIGSRFQSVERKVTQHFTASMSVRLHRIRCSACSGFGVHDGWNTHDGRLSLDNNICEQQMRAIALGRRNYLFCGSHDAARRTAVLYSLMRTCAQHNVPPLPYLTDVLRKLADGWPQKRIHELLPDRWQPTPASTP